jgi:magnesium-dependent phosphatase 1
MSLRCNSIVPMTTEVQAYAPTLSPLAEQMDLTTMAPKDALVAGKNPDIFVFDLDYTIWPFDCDKDVIGPFYRNPQGVYDSSQHWANPYYDVPAIMATLYDAGIPVAFLSRNPSHASIEQLLKTIPMQTAKGTLSLWDAMPNRNYFHAFSTVGANKGKTLHFATLHRLTNVAFENMLFFDDLPQNIHYARKQGTTSVELDLRRGLNWMSFLQGLTLWRARHQ